MSYQAPPPSYGSAGQPGFGGGATREHPQGTIILVLGILSLVICGLLGPVAWIMGNNAMKEIKGSSDHYTNRGTVQAGRICGIISSVLIVLAVLAIVLLTVLGSNSSSS